MRKTVLLLSIITVIEGQNECRPCNSSFPGGYVTISYQIGKNSNEQRFRDLQVSFAVVIPHGELPVFPFCRIDLRLQKNEGWYKTEVW